MYGPMEVVVGCSHVEVECAFPLGTYVWVESEVDGVGYTSIVVAPGPRGPRFLVGWADNQGYP